MRALSAQALRGNIGQLAGPTPSTAPVTDPQDGDAAPTLPTHHLQGSFRSTKLSDLSLNPQQVRPSPCWETGPRVAGRNQAGGVNAAAKPYKHHKSHDFNSTDHS